MSPVPTKVASRISDGIKKFQPIVELAKSRDINESDTVVVMIDILSNVFGFDKYTDITTEHAIKGTYCDLALKIDGKLKLLIEVKAIGSDLKESHAKQAIDYAANEGLEWVILSNAVHWKVFKVVLNKSIQPVLVCDIDFLALKYRSQDDVERMFIFTKEAINRSSLDQFYTQKQATSKFIIGNLICTESIINSIRKELRLIFPDIKVQTDEIKKVLLEEVIKREIIEGEDSENAKRKIMKVYKKRDKSQEKDTQAVKVDAVAEENSGTVTVTG